MDKTFRTKAEREFTGIGGSSMGGLVSIFFRIDLSGGIRKVDGLLSLALGHTQDQAWLSGYF